MASNGPRFRQEIQQMMYVAGESQEASVETISLVEEIIRDQVALMLTMANHLAARRGSRVFSNNDLIFQFRHDAARVGRLRNFLAWKGIRKATKESEDDKAELATVEEPASFDDLAGVSSEGAREAKAPIVLLPWDISSFFPDEIPDYIFEDETPDESNEAALEKLRKADDKTRGMTAKEYATWSEYRHASFTWRKVKRFREWAGLGVIGDHKPNDDVLDILGFLTCEMVQKLTEVALEIQARDMTRMRRNSDLPPAPTAEALAAEGLFSSPRRSRQPIECRHVRLAFETFQVPPKRSHALLNGTRLPQSNGLRLI
ncbi:transcription initiation factor IID, 18kD subunit-domain-containing protein [Dactylonectria estremocensis]|uniref:Transcription initiation factor IID, 18kD subunit-domain-containing protein n=1 Tax=Dactylonectria estremocensis TaxID=1079267 RepID=A0A9P9ELE8_9HYPO|nr:transcription initiation factor IID, 18kD subunit-domain-containing protein [Dactylonectria estremocensis]